MHLRRPIILAAALVAITAGSAQACPNHGTKTATAVAPHAAMGARSAALVAWKPRPWAPAMHAAPPAQGLQIAIDPVDGARGMPAAGELQPQLVTGDGTWATDERPVQIDRAPDGTLTAHLDERWADFAVATVGAGGKPTWSCVHGPQGAAQFMKQPAAPVVATTPKWEDK
jgi:hypothetical protein